MSRAYGAPRPAPSYGAYQQNYPSPAPPPMAPGMHAQSQQASMHAVSTYEARMQDAAATEAALAAIDPSDIDTNNAADYVTVDQLATLPDGYASIKIVYDREVVERIFLLIGGSTTDMLKMRVQTREDMYILCVQGFKRAVPLSLFLAINALNNEESNRKYNPVMNILVDMAAQRIIVLVRKIESSKLTMINQRMLVSRSALGRAADGDGDAYSDSGASDDDDDDAASDHGRGYRSRRHRSRSRSRSPPPRGMLSTLGALLGGGGGGGGSSARSGRRRHR